VVVQPLLAALLLWLLPLLLLLLLLPDHVCSPPSHASSNADVPAFSHLHVGFALMLQQRLLSTCGAPALPQRIYTLPTVTTHNTQASAMSFLFTIV
jgi:hypothetical protein